MHRIAITIARYVIAKALLCRGQASQCCRILKSSEDVLKWYDEPDLPYSVDRDFHDKNKFHGADQLEHHMAQRYTPISSDRISSEEKHLIMGPSGKMYDLPRCHTNVCRDALDHVLDERYALQGGPDYEDWRDAPEQEAVGVRGFLLMKHYPKGARRGMMTSRPGVGAGTLAVTGYGPATKAQLRSLSNAVSEHVERGGTVTAQFRNGYKGWQSGHGLDSILGTEWAKNAIEYKPKPEQS